MAEQPRLNILTGGVGAPRARSVPAAQPESAPGPAEALMGKTINWALSKMFDEADGKAKTTAAELEAARAERAALEAQQIEERAARERAAAEHQAALDLARADLTNASAVAEHLRTELSRYELETARLQEAAARTAEAHRQALAAAQAEREAVLARAPVSVTAPSRPEKIDFEYHRSVNGLLSRVVLKAAGYDDVAVEIARGGDNKMKQIIVR